MKIFRLTENEITKRTQQSIVGGNERGYCFGGVECGCLYEGQPGGSTTGENYAANKREGKFTPGTDAGQQ